MKKFALISQALLALALTPSISANPGFPEKYEGVMLQGFYWDSYDDTKWTNLTSQADELSKYFDLIWIPNSGSCGGGKQMGYMPQYWFTNHNSSFGTEEELLNMIRVFKEKGTGFIADVVINHRNGVTNWTDFPTEEWNGTTWKIGPEGICRNDEVASASGQATPTGANDTGDNFDGARDLDHTNANVQDNCKNYQKCLMEKYGYAGFRLDMVKGYGGQYTKIYNDYSQPEFCVGEYWDASYDAVKAWIDATGKTSAAFDFPCKYAINKAFSNNNMKELVWKANGITDQPAGMIHFGYPQYSVTFVDNHDTYREDGSKFGGDVVAANAFILSSPGTPCVFLSHWIDNKEQLKPLILARKACGVSNTSRVDVIKSETGCYVAKVYGSKGTLGVRIGWTTDYDNTFSSFTKVASGPKYSMWMDVAADPSDGVDLSGMPKNMYVVGTFNGWAISDPTRLVQMGAQYVAPNITLTEEGTTGYSKFTFITATGTKWDEVNQSDRYGAASADQVIALNEPAEVRDFTVGNNPGGAYNWKAPAGTYDIVFDFKKKTVTLLEAGSFVYVPDNLFMVGNIAGSSHWNIASPVALTRDGNSYIATDVVFESSDSRADGDCYFNFQTGKALTFDILNNKFERFGASEEGLELTPASSLDIKRNWPNGEDAFHSSSTKSFSIKPGKYDLVANFATNKLSITKTTSLSELENTDPEKTYYTLQGLKLNERPSTPGIYIVVYGAKVEKELIK